MARVDAELSANAAGHVLVFIHGYNNRFESAVYRLAQIVHDSDAPVVPVLFTWPSRGKLLAYTYDRESANFSRDALERLLTLLARNPKVDSISILTHSMGNWVTLEALRQMAIRNGRILPKIKDVMMAAPDVDVDVFRTQLAQLASRNPTSPCSSRARTRRWPCRGASGAGCVSEPSIPRRSPTRTSCARPASRWST